MKRLIIVSITLIMLLISWGILYSKVMQSPLHQSIFKQDISDIQVYGSTGTKKIEDGVLVDNIIKWFNQASDIRINKDFAGTTPESGIIINLKSGKRILILNSGSDFEIQRDDVRPENVSYWAKQQDIKVYLERLVAVQINEIQG
ncbi:hypothetical protein Bccel_1121 [Pseudobacteroides cellulosolvens ATCC 35603 = DSM 2933]|uniref:Uncharacterized protein n=1 Tax=Pseudobacteroides cellulosolvens ATCC 35603 = DSM 2933 TaxID=398512 RepID=A0A0L6JJ17_9FIRM|nr:hypothetical protein Bccel_1121 [Pseudobacteroides cellulosolvens ATCC 35603 = DSM 2933]